MACAFRILSRFPLREASLGIAPREPSKRYRDLRFQSVYQSVLQAFASPFSPGHSVSGFGSGAFHSSFLTPNSSLTGIDLRI